MSGTNGDAREPREPRGRVFVTGLSGRPFDHADAMGAVAIVVTASGKVQMHCSIRGAVLRELVDILMERYYFAPQRETIYGEMERKAATGIVTANVVPPTDVMPLEGRA